jgi:hypothetical protein
MVEIIEIIGMGIWESYGRVRLLQIGDNNIYIIYL